MDFLKDDAGIALLVCAYLCYVVFLTVAALVWLVIRHLHR